MDKVRFGRALGYGARHAAKSLMAAASAAAAPSPRSSMPVKGATADTLFTTAEAQSTPQMAGMITSSTTGQRVLRSLDQARAVQQQAGRQARRSFFGPFARFSSVVSLQVTGTFFALLALIMGQAAWRSRTALHLGWGASEARRLYLVGGIALLFAYFAVSNFVRAHQRDRR